MAHCILAVISRMSQGFRNTRRDSVAAEAAAQAQAAAKAAAPEKDAEAAAAPPAKKKRQKKQPWPPGEHAAFAIVRHA